MADTTTVLFDVQREVADLAERIRYAALGEGGVTAATLRVSRTREPHARSSLRAGRRRGLP